MLVENPTDAGFPQPALRFAVEGLRTGAHEEAAPLIEEIAERSPEFRTMWRDNNVQGPYRESVKRIRHPQLGLLSFEYSAFSVDGRTDLSLVVYNPATAEDAARIRSLAEAKGKRAETGKTRRRD